MEIKLNTVMPFGKYKGWKIDDLMPEAENEYDSLEFKKYVHYLGWVAKNTQHTISEEVAYRAKQIMSKLPKRKYSYSTRRGDGNWNSMGGMTDISFQDCYGDFGW